MSDMKCPFCQQELEDSYCDGVLLGLRCKNTDCLKTNIMYGNELLWQELIRTREALDKAKWWLKEIVESHRCTPISTAEMALKEITALEQKE